MNHDQITTKHVPLLMLEYLSSQNRSRITDSIALDLDQPADSHPEPDHVDSLVGADRLHSDTILA